MHRARNAILADALDRNELPGNKALSGIKSKMYKGISMNEEAWLGWAMTQTVRLMYTNS